jgi:hypothetical protein
MNPPTPKPPQQNDAAATAPIASAAEASAPAEKTAAKTAVKTTPKRSRKAAVKAKAVATPVVASTPRPPVAAEIPTVTVVKTAKPKKAKLVRDSFTMPESEYNLIAEVKKRCLACGKLVKKSEVLRAAIIAFAAQPDARIDAALQALEIIKTGRPPKGSK